jgi:hypothetical protein
MIGGKRYIDLAEWELWTANVTAAANGEPRPIRTARRREMAIAAAERELARELGGVGKK